MPLDIANSDMLLANQVVDYRIMVADRVPILVELRKH